MNSIAPATLPEIPGVEQLDAAPEGSLPFTRSYYQDGADELIAEARQLPNRERHCIVPKTGWPKRLWRKPEPHHS